MKQLERKPILLAAVLIALLLIAIPASAQQPACPTSGRIQTWTFGAPGGSQYVYVNLPKSAPLCPKESTGGCCDKVEVTGLTPGWKISGYVKMFYLFTTKYPNGDPRQRQEFGGFVVPLTVIDSSGAFVVNGICYPPSHGWPSAEVHVDVELLVTDGSGSPISWIGYPGTEGKIGPGSPQGGGWDPVCYNLGCTPGYWKTHPNSWPVSLPPASTTFFGVFGKPATWDANLKLLDAAGAKGSEGPDANMVRHCSSAYVGAVWAAQVYNPAGNCIAWGSVAPQNIIGWVQAAYADGTKAAFANAQQACASLNEDSICGPNGPWLNTETGFYGGNACLLPSGGPATPPKKK
jgi:hypothetical protein